MASCGAAHDSAGTPPRAPCAVASASAPTPEPPAKLYFDPESSPDPAAQGIDLRKLRGLRFVGMDNGPVPKFDVRATDGRRIDSASLVGNRAFIVVFFATWCGVCNEKLPYVKKALDELGPLTTILVSADEPETAKKIPSYLRKHGLSQLPVVRATRYPAFALSYDPFSMVPLVVVVGRNGGLVDFQMGIEPNDTKRLVKAVHLARTIGPLRPWHQGSTD